VWFQQYSRVVIQRQHLCHVLLWRHRSFMQTKNEESHYSKLYTRKHTFTLGYITETFTYCLWRYITAQGPAKIRREMSRIYVTNFLGTTLKQWQVTHCSFNYPQLASAVNRIWNNMAVRRLRRFSDGNLIIYDRYDKRFDTTVPCSRCCVNKFLVMQGTFISHKENIYDIKHSNHAAQKLLK
jgi:hypothetical protein